MRRSRSRSTASARPEAPPCRYRGSPGGESPHPAWVMPNPARRVESPAADEPGPVEGVSNEAPPALKVGRCPADDCTEVDMTPTQSVDRDRLLQTFLDLVAVDSPSGHEQAIGEVLGDPIRRARMRTSRDDIGNLVAVFPGRRAGTILFSTHMDTVGPDTGIQPIIGDDGVIRTDGSTILGADDKSGIAGCLELLTLLRATPGVDVPDHRVRGHGGRGGRSGRLSPPGRRQAERQPRVRDRHRGCDGLDHVLGADGGRHDRDLHGPQGPRRGGAREGHRRV